MPSDEMLTSAKKDGFSDKYLSQLLEIPEEDIRNKRISIGVEEAWEGVQQAERQTVHIIIQHIMQKTRNLVSTDKQKIMILGEVQTASDRVLNLTTAVYISQALKKMGFETIIVNCNPRDSIYRLRYIR